MPQSVDAWLRHQQQHWMRPDAARWLRPDAARFLKPGTDPVEVYPALRTMEEKGRPDQPRVPSGNRYGGRWTRDGAGGGASAGSDAGSSLSDAASGGEGEMLPEIEVVASSEPASGSDFWSNFWPGLSSLASGIGEILASLDEPPRIPKEKPKKSSLKTASLRAIARWLVARPNLAEGALDVLKDFAGWVKESEHLIQAYRDPPKDLQELMDGVGKHREGYDDHHIIEKTAAEKWGLV